MMFKAQSSVAKLRIEHTVGTEIFVSVNAITVFQAERRLTMKNSPPRIKNQALITKLDAQEENLTSCAEVIPFQNPQKVEYQDAIRMWCVNRNLSDALQPEEIAALPRHDRIDAQCKSIIINLCHYYRQHPRADVAPGVAVIIALLSDNEKGLATISQPTLATFFGRSRSAIGDAQKRLKDASIIGMTRGRFAGSYPIIPRDVTRHYNHKVWLIEALNTQDGALNLPAPPADCQSTGPTGGLNETTGPTGGLKFFNQPVEGNSINRPDATQLHKLNSTTTLDRAARVAALGIATALASLPAAAEKREPPAIVQSTNVSLADLTDRMTDAAGKALANPAGAMGLLTFVEQKRWLDAGCDVEIDILQTIRAVAARQPPGSIRTWKYFTQAIADAKAARESPMPEGLKSGKPKSEAQEWHAKQEAALKYLRECTT
jgi:hypothetical protein